MKYTPEIISKLSQFLDKIRAEELRAQKLCQKLDKQLKEMVAQKEINDFQFRFSFGIYSFDKEFCKKHNIEEGFPFYEEEDATFLWNDEEFMNINWNELNWVEESPLKDLHFCYTAHRLFFHTDLTTENLLAMDEFDFNVIVDYQSCTKL